MPFLDDCCVVIPRQRYVLGLSYPAADYAILSRENHHVFRVLLCSPCKDGLLVLRWEWDPVCSTFSVRYFDLFEALLVEFGWTGLAMGKSNILQVLLSHLTPKIVQPDRRTEQACLFSTPELLRFEQVSFGSGSDRLAYAALSVSRSTCSCSIFVIRAARVIASALDASMTARISEESQRRKNN